MIYTYHHSPYTYSCTQYTPKPIRATSTYLQPRVHLEEIEVLLVVGQHLNGAGASVVHSLAKGDGLLLHGLAGGRGKEGGGRLLYHSVVWI